MVDPRIDDLFKEIEKVKKAIKKLIVDLESNFRDMKDLAKKEAE